MTTCHICGRNHEAEQELQQAELAQLREALAAWRAQNPAPDCTACAVLDAATCGMPTE